MYQNDTCSTSYRVAHKYQPSDTLDSNVTALDTQKKSIPNNPNLKQWNYETTTNINHDFKLNTMDTMQKSPISDRNDRIRYLMPHWEKYWSTFLRPINTITQNEFNSNFTKSKFTLDGNEIPISCIRPKQCLDVRKDIPLMSVPTISEKGVIRKRDPYVSTQKLAYIKINPITNKQLNSKFQKRKKILPEYESFYTEPIFNRLNTIRLIPNTLKHVPHNGLRTVMSESYKTPINKLSEYENTVEVPIAIPNYPSSALIFTVPGMYTTEYSIIGTHKRCNI
ncbi:Hypothetical protein CINCED_3A005044 [Cinara cedri]|uniref:Uncharacterized protein n=1 Tax=Cinara cedri TaxID=506608 RepID=A0A5E4N7H1_9HEMI|nr:Hypothetical protein CINCED_3A005044 [Cinara cedri]